MTQMPYYASAEQVMRDRSEYARKGISRGRSVAVLTYADGILFIAENPSATLHKIGEIYDRIGFAAVGRYSEFETLRQAGVRLADVRGYSYNRRDVTGRVLANAYAQTLGAIFTEQMKPYEVEVCVADLGEDARRDELYRLTFDGSVFDEPDFVVMGGHAETVSAALRSGFQPRLPLAEALALGASALASGAAAANGSAKSGTAASSAPTAGVLPPQTLEVAVLDRGRTKRTFRRIRGAVLRELLRVDDGPEESATEPNAPASEPDAPPTEPEAPADESDPSVSPQPDSDATAPNRPKPRPGKGTAPDGATA
ncbi:MAG: proteasome subunit alpha [Actinomycetota bacterium]|nr:proteasome subunit alpha [Actinomycetota bacterium]